MVQVTYFVALPSFATDDGIADGEATGREILLPATLAMRRPSRNLVRCPTIRVRCKVTVLQVLGHTIIQRELFRALEHVSRVSFR